MTSKREDIVAYIESILAPVAGISGRVFRGRPDPANLNETPCIFLEWTNNSPDYSQLSFADWTLSVNLQVITRGQGPDVLADPIITSAHNILMADRSLGGLVLDILPGAQRMDIITGDKPVGVLTSQWLIKHRTDQNTLD